MLWALNVAILAASALTADQRNHSANAKNASVGWLESLRRQLMQDNYDYQAPSSSENAAETTPSKATATPAGGLMWRAETNEYFSPKYLPPQYAPMEGGEDLVVGASTSQDVLLYMDERMAAGLGRRRNNQLYKPKTRNVSTLQPAPITKSAVLEQRVVTEPTQNVTLKLIRLGRRGGWRRGGGGAGARFVAEAGAGARFVAEAGAGARFVAEAGAGGAALVSVDGAPFPALRLPPDLRQYRHDPAYDLF